MSTTVSPPAVPKSSHTPDLMPAEQCVILDHVAWKTYVALCDEPSRHVRMNYDRGILEIMSPGQRHKEAAHIMALMINAWTEAVGIEVKGTRSMTCRRESEERGFEGDNSYYVSHEKQMRGVREFNSDIHPPPDVVVEIDISRSAMNKLAIYEHLKVPEVWIFDGHETKIFASGQDGRLTSVKTSRELPGFPFDQIASVIEAAATDGENAAIAAFRSRTANDRGSAR